MNATNLLELPAFDPESGLLNTIVETPRGNRSKYHYDPVRRLFYLKKMLPTGAIFPFDFGFVPGTLGEDGDPLDVLILKEEPSFPGCLVSARLVGIIEARQTRLGKTMRNDRLIAAADGDALFCNVKKIKDLSAQIIDQIEHFFISYNLSEGKKFEIIRRTEGEAARKLVLAGQNSYIENRTRKAEPKITRRLRTVE